MFNTNTNTARRSSQAAPATPSPAAGRVKAITHAHQLQNSRMFFRLSFFSSYFSIPLFSPSPRVQRAHGHRHTQSLGTTPLRSKPTTTPHTPPRVPTTLRPRTPPPRASTGPHTPLSHRKHHRAASAAFAFTTPPPHLCTPPRAAATLAMSIPIHAPAPSSSATPPSPYAHVRPLSPYRPPSRSEQLLRSTLARARVYDEGEGRGVEAVEDDDDEEPWMRGTFLFRSALANSNCTMLPPPNGKHHDKQEYFRAPATPRRHSHSHSHSVSSQVSAPGAPGRSRSHTSTDSAPHEVVLKARLEAVLAGARRSRSRSHSSGKSRQDSRSLESTSSCDEGCSERSDGFSPLTPPPTPPARKHALYTPSQSHSRSSTSDAQDPRKPRQYASLPPTPSSTASSRVQQRTPSSPTFDAQLASQHARQMTGYVSFACVAGLGAPPEDEDEEDAHEGRRWFAWVRR
ncbi:hypothetical protein PLICRDRAFT_464840 [Plicaturopsis crispa FD-325 SS-3]|nr:hypothetical protein PLICRDRAFT_464840 [Plicaturopsis crispa FD-325 SS-3]